MANRKSTFHMGRRLDERLRKLEMRKSHLAALTGRTRQQVGQLIRKADWQGKTVQLIAKAVGVEPGYFFRAAQ